MEGFDIRTLALTNLWLGLLLGVVSLVFARIHPSFNGFKQLGFSYFLFSFGFVLVGLRSLISDFLSIVVANTSIVLGFSLLIIGILKFLHLNKTAFEKSTYLLISILFISFTYLTYFHPDINARIIVVSVIIIYQSLYAGLKVLNNNEAMPLVFANFLGFSFLYCAAVYLFRMYLMVNTPHLNNFMNAGTVHALALIALQLVIITSCFSLTISASQQLAHKLAIQATVDSLTNIYNRRAFDEFAAKNILRAQRDQTPIAVILMDIDLFKQVNDKHGHQTGDAVLQEFSLRLTNNLREYDILARYGGEEFTLLLPDTCAKTAVTIAEKLRYVIAQPVFCLKDGKEFTVTASFGVAANQGKTIDWQQLISAADQALYQAKAEGRNCVRLSQDEYTSSS